MGTLGLPPYNPLGALPQTPLRGFPLRLPSSLRGGFKLPGWNQVSLRFLILVFVRFALENGGTIGLPPYNPLGALPQTPLRGFPLRLPSSLRGGFKKCLQKQRTAAPF